MPEPTPVALVTGAARRLGAAIAQQLHVAGYAVVLHCRGSRDEADALAARLEARRAGSNSRARSPNSAQRPASRNRYASPTFSLRGRRPYFFS